MFAGQLHTVTTISPAKSATDNLILFKGSRPSCASWSVICWNLRVEAGLQVHSGTRLQASSSHQGGHRWWVELDDGVSQTLEELERTTPDSLHIEKCRRCRRCCLDSFLCLCVFDFAGGGKCAGFEVHKAKVNRDWESESLKTSWGWRLISDDFWWVEFPKLAMVGPAGAEDWRCTHWTCWLSFSRKVFLAHSSHRCTVWHWEKSHDLSEKIVLSQWLIIKFPSFFHIFPIKPQDLGWTPYLDKPIFILPQHSCLLWLIWTLIACHCTPCTLPCNSRSSFRGPPWCEVGGCCIRAAASADRCSLCPQFLWSPNYRNVSRFQNDLPRLMPKLVIPHLISLDPRISMDIHGYPLGKYPIGSSDSFLFGSLGPFDSLRRFTTLTCIPGVIYYNDVRIQLLDLPGLIVGARVEQFYQCGMGGNSGELMVNS